MTTDSSVVYTTGDEIEQPDVDTPAADIVASIDELAKKQAEGGWHALTEAEIEKLFRWRVDLQAANDAYVEMAAQQMRENQLARERAQAAYDDAHAAFVAAAAYVPQLEVITGEQA